MNDGGWMDAHKGEYVRTVGYIWECGDDDCLCEQARITDYFRNKLDPRFRVPVDIWKGTFTTREGRVDGEPSPDVELATYRRCLRIADPDREATIEWQGGIEYEL